MVLHKEPRECLGIFMIKCQFAHERAFSKILQLITAQRPDFNILDRQAGLV